MNELIINGVRYVAIEEQIKTKKPRIVNVKGITDSTCIYSCNESFKAGEVVKFVEKIYGNMMVNRDHLWSVLCDLNGRSFADTKIKELEVEE